VILIEALTPMRKTKIVFSKELDIDPNEFVAIWNNTPESREVAEAELSQPDKTQFAAIPLEWLVILGGIANVGAAIFINIVSNRLDELLKSKRAAQTGHSIEAKDLEFKEIRQADGSILIKVSLKKEVNSCS
jgi:hypothetical protein